MGYLLPPGTPVYCLFPNFSRPTLVHLDLDAKDLVLLEYDFVFDPEDGLWASRTARVKWRWNPHLHPNYTLFQALHTKLKFMKAI